MTGSDPEVLGVDAVAGVSPVGRRVALDPGPPVVPRAECCRGDDASATAGVGAGHVGGTVSPRASWPSTPAHGLREEVDACAGVANCGGGDGEVMAVLDLAVPHPWETRDVVVMVGSAGADGSWRGREGKGAAGVGLEAGDGEGAALVRVVAQPVEAGAVVVIGSAGAEGGGRGREGSGATGAGLEAGGGGVGGRGAAARSVAPLGYRSG